MIFAEKRNTFDLTIYTHVLMKILYVRGAFDSAKNRKRQSVTAKREKSQTPKFV